MHLFGINRDVSKFYSERNEDQIRLKSGNACYHSVQLTFGAETSY